MKMLKQEKLIGIDIGTETIKMVKAVPGGRMRMGTARIPDGVIKDFRIQSPVMVAEVLRKLKRKAKIGGSKCALCLPSSDVVIRQFVLPDMDEKHLYENVLSEISGYLPVNPERFVIDYRIQEEIVQQEAKSLRIMVVAIARDRLDEYIRSLSLAGFKIKYIDITENALEKLMGYAVGSQRNYATVDLGADKISVCLYAKGSFFINRVLPTGFNRLVAKVAESTNRMPSEVRKGLLECDLTHPDPDNEYRQHLTQHLDDLVMELIRLQEFFRNRNFRENLETIYLYGGFSNQKGIVEYLKKALSIDVLLMKDIVQKIGRRDLSKADSWDYLSALAVTFREADEKK